MSKDIIKTQNNKVDGNKINFLDVSSNYLFNMDKDLTVKIDIGTEKELETIFDIPSPTIKDKKRANSLENMTTKKRQELIRSSIEKSDTWLVAYMFRVFAEKDSDLNWFNPNHMYRFQLIQDTRSLLSVACRDGSPKETAILLQYSEIAVNEDAGDGLYSNPIVAACNNKNEYARLKIVTMLCSFKLDRLISGSGIKNAKTKTIRNLFKEAFDKQNNKHKQIALPPPKPEKTNSMPKDKIIWKKLDNSSISKLTSDGGDFRLRKIFNFESSTVSECNEYLNDDKHVITVSQPIITSMSRVSCKKEIEQAQKHLKKANKLNNA